MAAPIFSYRPEIQVKILNNDMTVQLGDVGSCQIRKNLYAPAGEFQLTFADMPVVAQYSDGGKGGAAFRESLYGLVNPMDKIVIMMRRWREPNPTVEPWIPVLTGFVRDVGRDESVGTDGRVQRQVIVAGQDCGGAFIMEQVAALITYQNQGGGILPGAFNWLREYQLITDPQKIEEFIWDVATKTTSDIMKTAEFEFQKKFWVKKGTVSPWSAFSQEGSVWEMIKRYSDAPWNELFVRENRNMKPDDVNPELVFRPTPWYDIEDKPLPDVDEESITLVEGLDEYAWLIPMSDVVALRAHRTERDMVNHLWLQSPTAQWSTTAQMYTELKGRLNDDTRAKYGDRIQANLATYLNPSDSQHPMNLKQGPQRTAEDKNTQWIQERLNWALLAHSDVQDFENGSLTMKGYPQMRVGDYFALPRGDITWEGYITNITHDFQPFRHYLTTIDYIRGTQIIKRREVDNPWDKERKQGAA